MKINYRPADIFALLVIFLFPVSAVLMAHGGGAVLGMGALVGLFYFRHTWPTLVPEEKRIFAAFVLCVAAMSVSLVNTEHLDEGLKRLEKLLQLLLLLPFYFTLRQARGVDLTRVFYLSIAISALLFWFDALKEISELGADARARGAYYEILFGDIATLCACILAVGIFTLQLSTSQKVAAAFAAVAALHTSILSGTRGGWILIPVVALGATLVVLSRRRMKLRYVAALAVIAALVVTAVTLTENRISKGFNLAIKEFKNYDSAPNTSVGARMNMWIDSVQIWREHPMLGTGIGDFMADQQRLIDTGQSRSTEAWGHAHSIFMDTLASAGLLGLAGMAFGLIIIPLVLFGLLWRRATLPGQRFCASTGILTIVAFAVFGLTEGWLTRNPFVRSYGFFVLTLMAAYYGVRQPTAARPADTAAR